MEHFLINSSVCLFVLWLVYKLLLENTSWHVFKRVYLLGAIIISVVIPFLVVKTVFVPVQELPVLEFQNSMAVPQVTHVTAETGFAIDWVYVALGLYLLGVCIMLFRFTKNLLAFKIQKNDVVSNYASYLLILRGEVTVPHSFWNRIFVSKKQYEQDLIPTVVLEHEKTHLDQKHSLDVLFVELLLVLFWFNPVLYMLRYAIKLNH
ncbi:MAG: peptidase M56, partial [Nonlabens sp.]|nr:peptidase M56 [Nonlabens sp.]